LESNDKSILRSPSRRASSRFPPPNPLPKELVRFALNSRRRSSGESRLCWQPARLTCFFLPINDCGHVPGKKPAETAARKQAVLAGLSIGLDEPQGRYVVTAVVPIGGAALEIGNAVGEYRALPSPGVPAHAGNLSPEDLQCYASDC